MQKGMEVEAEAFSYRQNRTKRRATKGIPESKKGSRAH